MGIFSMEKGHYSGGTGIALTSNYLAINLLLYGDDLKNLDAQAGFSVIAGRLILFYNYRFNIIAEENLLPFSLLHHTGLAFRLNNVDKRKVVKTINIPKL